MTTALIVPFGADDSETGRARQAIWNRCRSLWTSAPTYLSLCDHRHLIVAGDPLFGLTEFVGNPAVSNVVRRHPFSVARAINRAVRLAPPEVDQFVCIGADALPDWRVVDWAAEELDRRPWTLLFGKGASYDAIRTDCYVNEGNTFEVDIQPHLTPTVGPIAFTRETFLAVRGFDERFEGWGCEDVDLWNRLRALVGAPFTGSVYDTVSPYPLIQFSHPTEHHDVSLDNPNMRLYAAKVNGTDAGKHLADQLFGVQQ